MLPIRSASLITVAILAGCASNPPVLPASSSKSQFDGAVYPGEVSEIAKATPGAELFRAFYQGGSSFVSVSSVRETVEEMADKQCARQGKLPRPIQETTSKPPHILGNFPRVELLFECTDTLRSKSSGSTVVDKIDQVERLKRLLDSGALTRQEFDREKAKLLNAP